MGRTALYRDPVPWRPARAEVQLDPDTLLLRLPEGGACRIDLDGCIPATFDGVYAAHERRFVRMLVLERAHEVHAIITPPEQGAVAPNVLRLPEARHDAAIIEPEVWDVLADWVMGGGRLAGCAIADLARLAMISSPQFAALIGEVAAQRALELLWATRGPLRGGSELEIALQPFSDAARYSPRAAEALVSALAHAAGVRRRRRRTW
jgi:hypothetical protein